MNHVFLADTLDLLNEREDFMLQRCEERVNGMSRKCEKENYLALLNAGSNLVKYLFHISLIFLSTNAYAIECNFDGTQMEMNQCAFEDFETADRKPNQIYQILLRKMQSDKIYINNPRNAQRAWILFRDKELEAMFSCAEENKKICWGSMYGLLYANAKA